MADDNNTYQLEGLDKNSDGPKTYRIDSDELGEIESDLNCKGIEKIVLLVEDNKEQRENIYGIAQRYFSEDPKTSVCVTSNVAEAEARLAKYKQFSPDALMYGVLDYNMGESEPGQKRPTEALFHSSEVFQHYLNNGGVLIYNTGFPEQVKQSSVIMDAQRTYDNLLMLITAKDPSKIKTETVVRFLSNLRQADISKLRVPAERCGHDLVNLITALDRLRNKKR